MKSKLKAIVDSQLSQLDWTPEDSARMLRQMTGEIHVKKRLTFSLALAMGLLLLAVSALAVGLWKNYYGKIATNEGEIGYFDTWSGEKRAEFVLMMRDEGIEFDQMQIRKLEDKNIPDKEKADIATRLLIEKYGLREDTITAISILEKEKGPLPGWSLADKAEYTQMLVRTNTLGYDEEMFWLPGDKDIPQERAVELAEAAITQSAQDGAPDLGSLVMRAELRSRADEPENRMWFVFYLAPDAELYSPSRYEAWIDAASGEVKEVSSPLAEALEHESRLPPPEIREMAQQLLSDYRQATPFSMEDLVRLKADWEARIEEMLQHDFDWEGYYGEFRNAVQQDLRLPEAGAIPVDEARRRAEEAVLVLPGWTREKLDMFERYAEAYYHSGELNKSVYQFIFAQKRSSAAEFIEQPWAFYEDTYLQPLYALFGGDNASTPRYVSVRLDAKTGELTEAPVVGMLVGNELPEFALNLIR